MRQNKYYTDDNKSFFSYSFRTKKTMHFYPTEGYWNSRLTYEDCENNVKDGIYKRITYNEAMNITKMDVSEINKNKIVYFGPAPGLSWADSAYVSYNPSIKIVLNHHRDGEIVNATNYDTLEKCESQVSNGYWKHITKDEVDELQKQIDENNKPKSNLNLHNRYFTTCDKSGFYDGVQYIVYKPFHFNHLFQVMKDSSIVNLKELTIEDCEKRVKEGYWKEISKEEVKLITEKKDEKLPLSEHNFFYVITTVDKDNKLVYLVTQTGWSSDISKALLFNGALNQAGVDALKKYVKSLSESQHINVSLRLMKAEFAKVEL